MDRARMVLKAHHSASAKSDESAFDLERQCCNNFNCPEASPPPSQAFATGCQQSENNAAYFSWPAPNRLTDAAEVRLLYFRNLQKGVLPETHGRWPTGLRATTLLELMTIRAFHSKLLRCFSLGTAIGFRIRRGALTDIPAILVFVARKVHRQWLSPSHCLPAALEGPGGVWCDVDVVEFSYYGASAAPPKEQLCTELVDGFGGCDPCIGSGSQAIHSAILLFSVASQETYGTLGAVVKSRTGNREVGFLTNRHVAVDLDYPSQKMYHPLPPSLGPGVYLGAVERATSFVADDLWYGTFAGTNPETFVRADGAFIPFAEDFNMANVTTLVKGAGEIADVHIIDLQSPIDSVVGRQVVKVGRSSGLTTGTIMAYALEYNDEKGMCFFTDFLIVGKNKKSFDLEGDSGSLILLTGQNGEKHRPVGIIWGGTSNRGRLKLKSGQPPENWTSGVDLGRLLDLLELDLITSPEGLHAASREQRNASATGLHSALRESAQLEWITTTSKDKSAENFVPSIEQRASADTCSALELLPPCSHDEFRIEGGCDVAPPSIEHQFIPSFSCKPLAYPNVGGENVVGPGNLSLKLDEPEPKRRKQSNSVGGN
ncbi:Trypsin family protein isoform 1 [Dorcoceras hygrometricum]|uniref:Trypsin family protein isoform 1 n=1 Tax=Dorcoceras hygrometricum TaxID=472368 RepID=A0A2Z7ABD6_9LAMI|nr:Trypsin family protein isoform 1 [Dorcoceras hygrometricum]